MPAPSNAVPPRHAGQRSERQAQEARRPGYATAPVSAVGRRGARTRNKIKTCAADLFMANGYHATSVEAIATAVGGSRATIYQYFTSKEEIYAELVRECEDAFLAHAHTLADLGPHAEGLRNLRRWMHEWADIYDRYAVVLLEVPGIGTFDSLPVTDANQVAKEFRAVIAERLTDIGIEGLDTADAVSVLVRVSHMVNLYRYRGMFDLPSRTTTSEAVAIALQLMLFPDTDAIPATPATVPRATADPIEPIEPVEPVEPKVRPEESDDWPARQDVLAASSRLFAERGYHAVSMAAIASGAHIGRATLYRYFNTKAKILAALTASALSQSAHLAAELTALAERGPDMAALHAWMRRYVAFHRNFNGVIRAWFDGAVAEQLSSEGIRTGIGQLGGAVTAVLDRTTLPAGIEHRAATAIFMAVLGRMTEPTEPSSPPDDADRTADLMMLLLERSLLRSATVVGPGPGDVGERERDRT
ncbi:MULTISPECIES: TetR/AcrR family transcriptional regulator [Mycolicibacterium]|uniref:TetR/AcrR family transcriptional regulator n=1 Tax=Mycolicibacterium TaxID=1866885 RepID=UPI0009F37FFB|nr:MULTISPECIES: TetR/AcrR family transcriptional regulator [Mycolicibacterium]